MMTMEKAQGISCSPDQHQSTRLEKLDMKACLEDGRGPRPIAARRRLNAHAAIDAFDQQISPRNLVRSPNASGLASEAAGDLAVQGGHDERFFVHNGIVHDIRNVLQVLLSGLWVARDRIREGARARFQRYSGKLAKP
jgi:hypothetical protein